MNIIKLGEINNKERLKKFKAVRVLMQCAVWNNDRRTAL